MPEGTKVKDHATLTGEHASKAGGTVEYFYYSNKCESGGIEAGKVTVSEGSVPASSEEALAAGKTYYWKAVYSGDSKNDGSNSGCSEQVTVQYAPSISTALVGGGGEGGTLSVTEGTKVKDTATLSGAGVSTAGGTVTYEYFTTSACTGTGSSAGEKTVTSGSVEASNEVAPGAGTYYWKAVYSGDSLHHKTDSGCSETLTVDAIPPSEPTPGELTGGECKLQARNLRATCSGKPVNDATGNETEVQTDVSIGGRGPGLRVTRSYNSLNAVEASGPGVWGYGWTGPYDAYLELDGATGTATVHLEGGETVVFYTEGSKYTQGGWTEARFAKEGSDYVLTMPDQSKLEFNGSGELVKETDRDSNSLTMTYSSGKLEKVADAAGRELKFEYNSEGQVSKVTDPLGHVIEYGYTEQNLTSVTIEGKARWKLEYDASHELTKLADGRGNSVENEYDVSHRVVAQKQAGHTRKWSYGTSETTLTEPNGSETLEKFNAADESTETKRAKGKSEETTTKYEYNEAYALVKLTDPNGHATKYTYNAAGDKTSETDPTGDERKWTYDTKHDVESETTPEGETTTYTLNSDGVPEKIERPIGSEKQVTEYKYAANGDLEEETDPLKQKTKYTYDTYGDTATETDPEGDERKWKYNADSQVTEETSPRGFATTIERDEQGRPVKITDPLGHTTEYKYDGNGNIESETDGNKHTTKYEYNEENLPIKTTQPNGTVVETGYDAEGQMTSHTDGNKHVWEYKRNALEQVIEEKNPLEKTWKKTYEKAGNLETLEDPENHTTEYTYDNTGRLTKIKYSTGKPSEVTYEYNKDSKVTTMKDETGTTKNTWDKLKRLTEYENGAGKTVKYGYNLNNQPTQITYPNGKAVIRAYDKANRLESVTDWNSKVTSFTYNADSFPTATVFPSGSENEDTYAYNEADQMTEAKMTGPLGATLGKLVYERDGNGQVTNTTTTNLPGPETSESILDENNRLIEAQSKAYKYDKANNPEEIESTSGYTYNTADQLEKGGGNTYTYNEDGQRTKTKPEEAGHPTTTYTYDQAGNLTAVKRPEEGETTKIEDTYTYDGTNLRQTQTINGTTTNLTWDTAGPLPIILEDETNNYIYGPENLPIEQISTEAGETTLYLHHDQQGSTRLLTNTNGEKETAYTYSPYGRTLYTEGTAVTPLRYDAQYTSTDTGLIYLRARIYDPQTGQLLTIDSALQRTGEPYVYGIDNPESYNDSSGEQNVSQLPILPVPRPTPPAQRPRAGTEWRYYIGGYDPQYALQWVCNGFGLWEQQYVPIGRTPRYVWYEAPIWRIPQPPDLQIEPPSPFWPKPKPKPPRPTPPPRPPRPVDPSRIV